MSTATLFKTGDTVVWNPSLLDDCVHPVSWYGNGPFVVVNIHDPQTACQYPDSYCLFEINHSSHCAASNAQAVGHPQQITIGLPDGTSLAARGGEANRLSGKWFAHAELGVTTEATQPISA